MKLTKSKLRKIIREVIKEGFAGPLSRSDQKKFETIRKGNSEVLGYKLSGTSDVKTEIGLTEQKEVFLKIPIADKLKVDKILNGKLKLKTGRDYNVAGGPSGTFYLVLDNKTLNKVLDTLIANKIRVSY